MKKVLSYLFSLNLACIFFSLYLIKLIIVGTTFADSVVVFPLTAAYIYYLYLNSKKPDPVALNEEVQAEINNLRSKINSLSLERSAPQIKSQTKRYF